MPILYLMIWPHNGYVDDKDVQTSFIMLFINGLGLRGDICKAKMGAYRLSVYFNWLLCSEKIWRDW